MKELVEHLVRALVDHPEQVRVERHEDERAVTLQLRVASADMGKVIGKQGRIAKAIRTVVSAAAADEKKKVFVEIVD
ncbi:MAG: KH domain-containing protein [Dethiobacter sp.]|nr:KH domain-containing protein [Dethiobacter sp.]MCL5982120.1 KH domain-containing protein [Bacillota bacterium]